MADRTFLDWPFFDATHRALATELESWCAANLGAGHGEDIDAACRALVRRLGDGGWLRYCVPAAYGGVREQLDVRSLALIRETLARHDGLADFVFAMQGLGSGTISLFGSEAQKQVYLPAVASGDKIAAFALTEPTSGSDVASMETRADTDDDCYVVNGSKTYISNGGIADFYVLFARTGEAPGAKGVSAFIVEAGTEGLDASERIQVISPHPLATLKFAGLRLPADALLGERGRGFAQAMTTLDVFRTTVGAAALGTTPRRRGDRASTRASHPVAATPARLPRRQRPWRRGRSAVGAVRIHVVDGGQGPVGRSRRLLDRLAAPRQAVQHRHHPGYLQALLADALDRGDGRAARGDHVLDHQAAFAGIERRALDPALKAVGLSLLAHEEGLDVGSRGQRRARHRVGSHGQAAHRGGSAFARLGGHQLPQGGESRGPQDRPLGVHVVLRRGPAGEGDLADHQRVLAQLGDQLVAEISQGGHGACRF